MDTVEAGLLVEVTDALGRRFTKRVISDVNRSGAFPAVWACSEAEWDEAQVEGREPEAEPFPWPLSALRILADA